MTNHIQPIKFFKNTTGTSLFHTRSGWPLPANSYVIVDENNLPLFNDSQLWNWFDAGTIIYAEANDGSLDYTNKYEGWHRLFDYAFGQPFLSTTNSDRANSFTSITIQEAIEENRNSVIGGVHEMFFHANGTISNKWLEIHENGVSNEVPEVVPYNLELISIVVSNAGTNKDLYVDLYKVPVGLNITPANQSIVYSVAKTNCRAYRKSGFTPSITLNAGDKVAAKVPNTSKSPIDIHIKYKWLIKSFATYDVTANFSGDFS